MKFFFIVTILSILSLFCTVEAERYAKRYSNFEGEDPPARAKAFLNIKLPDLAIDEKSFTLAMDVLRSHVAKHSEVGGLSYILRRPNNIAYHKPIKITQKTMTIADAINLLCQQAGVTWDFSIKLTIKPKKQTEQGAAPDR